MKVVLIYPPHEYLRQPDSQMPLGLMYLASVLETNSIDVEIRNYSALSVEDAVKDMPEADIYGITATSLDLISAGVLAKGIKGRYPKSKVGVGGPGAITPEYVDWNYVDFICKGEAEKTILDIIEGVINNSLRQIYIGEPYHDLNLVPFPARHKISGSQGGNIFSYNKRFTSGDTTILLTTRGCPFKCAFCVNPCLTAMADKVRYRSVDNVVNEVKEVINTYGIRQFRVSDDMFTSNKQRMIELCKELKKLNIIWRISARVKPFDREMAEVLVGSGCKEASFGVESFDDEVLRLLNKRTTAEDNAKALTIAIESGLDARCLMMIRTPGQTPKTIELNKSYIKNTPYTIASCTVFVPMPGSDTWYNPDKYGIEILNKSLDLYNIYLFGKKEDNKRVDLVRLKGRDMDEVNKESDDFISFLKETGKLNQG
jgi:radical SAM superfamily enzyme YgiQ (UPF0313 family)